MARDSEIRRLVSPEALFHRFADLFRGFFLVCFSLLATLGLVGTGYFSAQVVISDTPNAPLQEIANRFNAPEISEFESFSDRLLQGQILWPQVSIPVDVATTDLTDKERKAIQAGSALLESLVASRGVEKDEERRQRVARLIEHAHQRLSVQPGIPDISFATLFFDHVMQASLQPAFFPTNASVAGQARERVDRYLTEYPLIHVQWFADQVSDRALTMARGSDQQASAMADYQLALAISDQQMQRNAVLTLVSLVMFSLSALLFLLIRIERNQTLQTQYMANRYVMYMPTPKSDP
jgi:VIT1/CCC1 family predicted Fe2+/Mn2+ transporter